MVGYYLMFQDLFPGFPPHAGVRGWHRQKLRPLRHQRPVLCGRHDRAASFGEAVGRHRGQ